MSKVNYKKLCEAYGIQYSIANSNTEFEKILPAFLKSKECTV